MDKVQAENLLRLVADMVESQGGDLVKIVSPVKQSSGQAQEVPGPRKTPGGQKNKGWEAHPDKHWGTCNSE